MDNFFSETYLTIEDESGNYIELRMRPLKVKELPQFMRISEKANRYDTDTEPSVRKCRTDEEMLPELIGLIKQTIDGDITQATPEALNGIIDAFMEINFPSGKVGATPSERLSRAGDTGSAKKKIDKIDMAKELAIAFDFLICQGHAFSEIMEYTLPQFRIFQQTACDRLMGKKKQEKNPLDVFQKMGIPVKNN